MRESRRLNSSPPLLLSISFLSKLETAIKRREEKIEKERKNGRERENHSSAVVHREMFVDFLKVLEIPHVASSACIPPQIRTMRITHARAGPIMA